MPGNKKLNKYLALMYGGLAVLIVALASFVYSLVRTVPEDLAVDYEVSEGVTSVNPSGNAFPTSAPYVDPPLAPPPGQ